MKTHCLIFALILFASVFASAQTTPSASPAPAATPAPPPSAPAKRSAADLEKLVAPMALYPDALIATMLPASVYPLEIVQAARFVADTNNLAKLDTQPWDESVKAVARVPAAIKQMNDELPWTIDLGEAFLAQDKDVMDAIQSMRLRAQKAGTLQTSPQQIVVVTNMITEKTIEQKVVVVTNTIVQIQPSNPQVIYVPTYNPYTVYYPPPYYVYNPYAPLVTFAAGVAVGAIIANNCNWYGGGVYHGGGGGIHIDGDVNINRGNINTGNINSGNRATANSQKWQPDQGRLNKSGSSGATSAARSAESRGWGSGSGSRPSTSTANARPSTGGAGARPSTGTPSARPSTGSAPANRAAASPSTSPARSSSAASRPASSGSAFNGASSGASANYSSSRGASSRSSSYSGGSGGRSSYSSGGGGGRSSYRGGGGGGRGGGGRR